jgi:hypothetical protein
VQAFIETFGKAEGAFIAGKLGYKTPQAVYKVIKGKGELGFEHLRKFKKETKRSIDWLLTGEEESSGRESVNPYGLTPEQLLFIRMLAEKVADGRGQKVTQAIVNEVVREIVFDGLDVRASELSLAYRKIGKGELENMLNAVLSVPREDDGGASVDARPDSARRHARARR